MSAPIIAADDIRKYFETSRGLVARFFDNQRQIKAVDGVDLEIDRGDIIGLVGESGCGKSTLGRVVLGLELPTSGTVEFKGVPLSSKSKDELRGMRKEAQMLFQNPYQTLNPRLTILDNLREPLKIHKIGSRDTRYERIHQGLVDVELNPDEILDRFPTELSGGQRQRVSIARAFLLNPDFIVADEPVSMLDVSIKKDMLDLLETNLDKNDACMLYISHDLSTVGHICDDIHVMYLGKIVERGPTRSVIEDPAHPYTNLLVQAIPSIDVERKRERIRGLGEVPSSENVPSGCRFHPRCPKIIPPDDWPADQTTWKQTIDLIADIMDGSALSVVDGDALDDAVVRDVYADYFGTADLPSVIDEHLRTVITASVNGDGDSVLEKWPYSSVCQDDRPPEYDLQGDHHARCYLLADSPPG